MLYNKTKKHHNGRKSNVETRFRIMQHLPRGRVGRGDNERISRSIEWCRTPRLGLDVVVFAVAVVAGHLASLPGSNRYVSLMFDTTIFFFSSYVDTANLIVIIYILLAIITHHMRSLCLDIRLSTLGSFGCVVVVQHGQSRSMQCLPRRGGNSKTSAYITGIEVIEEVDGKVMLIIASIAIGVVVPILPLLLSSELRIMW